jgi:hypothetical protein
MSPRPPGELDATTIEKLADQLQRAALSTQRLLVTNRQNVKDAETALDAVERAIGITRSAVARERERQRADPEKGDA